MSTLQNRWTAGVILAGLWTIASLQWGPFIIAFSSAVRASDLQIEVKSDDKEFDAADLQFFRDEIEPVFQDSCHRCHGEKKQESNLRLDSRDALLKGGKNGPTIVPGKPDESLLLKVLEYNGDIQMPPDEKLDDETRAAIKKWIEKKAPWPKAKAK